MTTITKLSQVQFEAAQDAVDARVRGAKRGSPERATAEDLSAAWEAILAAPQATFAQREARSAAIAEFAASHGLAQS